MHASAIIQRDLLAESAWRRLTPAAQHLYFTCRIHPTLTYAGVLDWRPGRIAALATGWTAVDVETAAAELEEAGYLVVDRDTEEAHITNFFGGDRGLDNECAGLGTARDINKVSSTRIHKHMAQELAALRDLGRRHHGLKANAITEYLTMQGADE